MDKVRKAFEKYLKCGILLVTLPGRFIVCATFLMAFILRFGTILKARVHFHVCAIDSRAVPVAAGVDRPHCRLLALATHPPTWLLRGAGAELAIYDRTDIWHILLDHIEVDSQEDCDAQDDDGLQSEPDWDPAAHPHWAARAINASIGERRDRRIGFAGGWLSPDTHRAPSATLLRTMLGGGRLGTQDGKLRALR
jgi:hypothetical protein